MIVIWQRGQEGGAGGRAGRRRLRRRDHPGAAHAPWPRGSARRARYRCGRAPRRSS